MTSQKKTNDDSPKGFAGLSSMVSDVGDVITSSEIKKPEVSNEEIINDSPKGFSGLVSMVSDVESMTEFQKSEPLEKKAAVNTNKSTTSTSPQQISENSSKNKNWIIVLGIIFGLIWLMSDSDKKSTTQHSTSTRPSEEKPPVGTNLTFNLAQIRYCLSEDIRMEGVKTVMDSYSKSDVDRFKGMIADYNSRCSQFHYRQGLLESAKRDVYPYRSVLELEGQGRFEHNISSKKQQLELGIKTYDSSSDATIIKLQNQSKKNTPIPLMGPKVSEVAENKKKSIVPNDSNVLSDARAMVIRMIDYALIDGGG